MICTGDKALVWCTRRFEGNDRIGNLTGKLGPNLGGLKIKSSQNTGASQHT